MIRSLLSICILNILTVFCVAQSDVKIAENWRIFNAQHEEFMVESPIDLKPWLASEKKDLRNYKTEINGTYIYIFSDTLKDNDQTKVVLAFADSQNQKSLDGTFHSYPSNWFTFVDNESFSHRILIVKTNLRTYSFHIVSPEKDSTIADRFFRTLSFNRPVESPLIPDPPKSVVKTPAVDSTSPSSVSGQGSGGGLKLEEQIPTPQTAQIEILTKPKALYTDFARFYDVSGRVRLRVTFLADGTIGSVTPVTRLPFGLTQKAIDAAKSMRFNPAIRDGQPYSVIKLVEYGFLLY